MGRRKDGEAPHASTFGLHLSAGGAGSRGRFQIRGERGSAVLRTDWDEQTRVWEASQKVIAGIQKKNNKTVVTFLHKNFKFCLLVFASFKILT